MALASRGPARGGDDGDAGQLAQADGLLVRRGRCRAHRAALRLAQRGRLPADVPVPTADHDLRDGHPRRRRQSWRASFWARSSSTSRSSCSASPADSRYLFYAAVILCVLVAATGHRSSSPSSLAARSARVCRPRAVAGRIDDSWVGGVVTRAAGWATESRDWVIVPVTLETWADRSRTSR